MCAGGRGLAHRQRWLGNGQWPTLDTRSGGVVIVNDSGRSRSVFHVDCTIRTVIQHDSRLIGDVIIDTRHNHDGHVVVGTIVIGGIGNVTQIELHGLART